MDPQAQQAFIETLFEYMQAEDEADARELFGWIMGFRTAALFCTPGFAPWVLRLHALTTAAIDARYYIKNLRELR